MTLSPAYAACRALLAARPDLPLLMHDDPGWSATPACDQDRPFVILSAQQRGVEIFARPRGGVTAPDLGFTLFVRYPLYDARLIGDDNADMGFDGDLRAAVEAKCVELSVGAPTAPEQADPTGEVLESAIGWLKRRRDEHPGISTEWETIDALLDDLRDHFYTGTPLGEDVQGPWAEAAPASVAERGCDECSSEPGEVHGGGCPAVAARGAR